VGRSTAIPLGRGSGHSYRQWLHDCRSQIESHILPPLQLQQSRLNAREIIADRTGHTQITSCSVLGLCGHCIKIGTVEVFEVFRRLQFTVSPCTIPRKDFGLTAIRTRFGSNRPPRPVALKTVAAVCLVMLALLAVAQVTHVHSVGSDADHCQLCIVMHSVVPFVMFVAGVLLIRIGTAAPMLRRTRTITRYWHRILLNRPPPAGC
jgi:hypothetical protein